MNYIQTRNRSSIRILAAFLAAFLLVLMLFSTTAHADFDSAACNYLQISFMQVQQNNLSTLLALNEGLYYKSPNLGGVYAHVMDVAGDDGQVGIGFCGNHAKALNSRQVRNDTWTYAGLWTPGGSAPFLDYYYATNFESDLIRAENPGQTEEWYAGALNTEEWGYAKYGTASQRYTLNTAVQLAVWLDRTGVLGNLPSAGTYANGWGAVKETAWYKFMMSELKTLFKAMGDKNASVTADNMLQAVLGRFYTQDRESDILVYEYLHSAKPDYRIAARKPTP